MSGCTVSSVKSIFSKKPQLCYLHFLKMKRHRIPQFSLIYPLQKKQKKGRKAMESIGQNKRKMSLELTLAIMLKWRGISDPKPSASRPTQVSTQLSQPWVEKRPTILKLITSLESSKPWLFSWLHFKQNWKEQTTDNRNQHLMSVSRWLIRISWRIIKYK